MGSPVQSWLQGRAGQLPSDGRVVSESLGCAGLQPLRLESSNAGPAGPLAPPSTQHSDGKALLQSTVRKI